MQDASQRMNDDDRSISFAQEFSQNYFVRKIIFDALRVRAFESGTHD
jgi:hypothetical protein